VKEKAGSTPDLQTSGRGKKEKQIKRLVWHDGGAAERSKRMTWHQNQPIGKKDREKTTWGIGRNKAPPQNE